MSYTIDTSNWDTSQQSNSGDVANYPSLDSGGGGGFQQFTSNAGVFINDVLTPAVGNIIGLFGAVNQNKNQPPPPANNSLQSGMGFSPTVTIIGGIGFIVIVFLLFFKNK